MARLKAPTFEEITAEDIAPAFEDIAPLAPDPEQEEQRRGFVLDQSEKTGIPPARLQRRQTLINQLFSDEDYEEAITSRKEEYANAGAAGVWMEFIDAEAQMSSKIGAAFKRAHAALARWNPLWEPTPQEKAILETRAKRYEEQANLLWEVAKNPDLVAEGEGAFHKAARMTGNTVPYIGATTLAYTVAGPLGGFAVGGLVEGHSAYQEAVDAGVEEKTARNIGLGVGIVNGAIESLGGKFTEEFFEKVIKKRLTDRIKQAGALFGMGTLIEALEEGSQEVSTITGEEFYRDVDWKERLIRVAASMAGGAFLGGTMRGMQIAGKRLVNERTERLELKAELTAAIQETTGLPQEEAEKVAQDAIDDKFHPELAEGEEAVSVEKPPITGQEQQVQPTAAKPRVQRTLQEIEALPEETLKAEAISLPKTHVTLGAGQQEFEGMYLSTEEAGNRYATPEQPAVEMTADIQNPKVFRSAIEYASYREQFIPEDVKAKIAHDEISDFEQDKMYAEAGKKATQGLKAQGYDSVYLPESETNEGILVVFDRAKVKPVAAGISTPEGQPGAEGKVITDADIAKRMPFEIREVESTSRMLPGGILEVDTREPALINRNKAHELGHTIYDYTLAEKGFQKEWDTLSDKEWTQNPNAFATSKNPAESFSETFSTWFTGRVEGRKGIDDLPKSFSDFMQEHFGQSRELPIQPATAAELVPKVAPPSIGQAGAELIGQTFEEGGTTWTIEERHPEGGIMARNPSGRVVNFDEQFVKDKLSKGEGEKAEVAEPPKPPPLEIEKDILEPELPSILSARNADIDEQRKRLGLDVIASPTRKADQQVKAEALKQDIPAKSLRIAADIVGGRESPLTDVEEAGMTMQLLKLHEEMNPLLQKLAATNDTAEIEALRGEIGHITAEYDTISEALHKGITEVARALRFRQVMIKLEQGTYTFLYGQAKMKAEKGTALTEKETVKLQELARKLAESEEKIKALQKQNEEMTAKQTIGKRGARKYSRWTPEQRESQLRKNDARIEELAAQGCY